MRDITREDKMGRHASSNFVITPHKRRGPIAAEFQSPGPAAINLPTLFGSKYNQFLADLYQYKYFFLSK